MMYGSDQGLIINEFGKGKEKITWQEFFRKITEIFGTAINGSRTYQNYFGGTEDEEGCDSRTPEAGRKTEPGYNAGSGRGTERTAPENLQGEREGTSEAAETGRPESKSGTADRPAAPERTESGQKSEEHKSQRTEQTTETSKTGNEPKSEKESKQEKSEIAPAQPDLKEVMNAPEETLETIEGEVIETPEEKVPFGSRWEYLKMQGTFSMALTLAAVISETEYGSLQMADFWDDWLKQEVDEEGETFESQTEKEA